VLSAADRRAAYDLAHLGDAIGEPSRAAMLVALLGGVALPASDLARAARVVPSTATSHLQALARAGLVVARSQGRHRYFALAGAHVAEAVERLVTLQAPAMQARRPRVHDPALALARTCYTHLAGRIAVAFWARARERGWVQWTDADVRLSSLGQEALAGCGLVVDASLPGRACLDWTERVPHVSGKLGVAVCSALFAGGWVKRTPKSRALRVTVRGQEAFASLGVRWAAS